MNNNTQPDLQETGGGDLISLRETLGQVQG